jgi:hypothetical protein
MKYTFFLYLGLVLCSQACFSDKGTEKRVAKIMNTIIEKIQSHDESVIPQCVSAQNDVIKSILDAWPSFDMDSRMLSVECFASASNSASAFGLLELTMDDDINVANDAARSLMPLAALIPVRDIFDALKKQDDPFIREYLYRIIGDSKDANNVIELRDVVKNESDPDAAISGLVAIVKLKGEPERKVFMDILREAESDDASELTEKLIYINDRLLIKGLLPWLVRQDGVFRLNGDRDPDRMVRMCDLAVWTAHRMGIMFEPPLTSIDIYEDVILSQAHVLISRIN